MSRILIGTSGWSYGSWRGPFFGVSALMAVGAVLFVVTLIVNALARWLVWRVTRGSR